MAWRELQNRLSNLDSDHMDSLASLLAAEKFDPKKTDRLAAGPLFNEIMVRARKDGVLRSAMPGACDIDELAWNRLTAPDMPEDYYPSAKHMISIVEAALKYLQRQQAKAA
jgi:hypothetical protein